MDACGVVLTVCGAPWRAGAATGVVCGATWIGEAGAIASIDGLCARCRLAVLFGLRFTPGICAAMLEPDVVVIRPTGGGGADLTRGIVILMEEGFPMFVENGPLLSIFNACEGATAIFTSSSEKAAITSALRTDRTTLPPLRLASQPSLQVPSPGHPISAQA